MTIIEVLLEIPAMAVALLGIGAVIKYSYQVFVLGISKNVGALVTMAYLTSIYIIMSIPGVDFKFGNYLRIGVVLLFLDKILVFAYDLMTRNKAKTENKISKGSGGSNGN